jgi:hypothetical protein
MKRGDTIETEISKGVWKPATVRAVTPDGYEWDCDDFIGDNEPAPGGWSPFFRNGLATFRQLGTSEGNSQ